ncbi:hypothetical protein JQ554_23350 [Bradyrhizobium diazoefficiens]|nr:hypothetical protein [Bradyrhizobium diazoefficiens]MBR0966990.1 hypothetical protein [Bradyrhizobium diazoefficiens]MBR0979114.1 hypothetical protein [Bradyrhizobium diazoefficiens]MBR1009973.1 hypothetical protein [Bradyrhizobium diazoefficiens]MBR1016551.1 hypothetical protein [Bradyrhizobium diazoefficiens]MBR1053811.1 hypothetical protein [Bradyrhizobium diazoefficiens]
MQDILAGHTGQDSASSNAGLPPIKSLGSEDVKPFFSLRLLAAEAAGNTWTSDWLQIARSIEALASSTFPSKGSGDIIQVTGGFIQFDQDTARAHVRLGDPNDDASLLNELSVGKHGWISGRIVRTKTKPSWMRVDQPNLRNVAHELLSIAVLPSYIAVSATQEALGRKLASLIEAESGTGRLIAEQIEPVPHELLDAALVKGQALSLALDGMHRPTVFKADRQILQGRDLREAIDPVSFRTFAYSSVRSLLETPLPQRKKRGAVGYSRKHQVVWVGPTKDAADYLRHLDLLSSLVEGARKAAAAPAPKGATADRSQNRLRYLSQEIDAALLSDAKEPFEIEWDLGEAINEAIPIENDRTEVKQDWLSHAQLEIIGTPHRVTMRGTEMVVPVRAFWDRQAFVEFDVVIHRGVGREIRLSLDNVRRLPAPVGESFLRAYETFDAIETEPGPSALTIRFESGHVLDRQRLFLPETPSVPFEDWRWIERNCGTRRFDLTKEKPDPWTVTRSSSNFRRVKTGDDLFSYVVHRVAELSFIKSATEWYLLCHDQPNEVADFVLIVPAARSVTHIHAKGAHSDGSARRVSIGAYELVVTQAIKNLPRLEPQTLLSAIMGSGSDHGKIGQFIVSGKNGQFDPSFDTSEFVKALEKMRGRTLLDKRVIIFQPHIRAKFWEDSLTKWRQGTGDPGDEPHPVFMLSSLLIDAKVACLRLGARFEVWGEWDGPGGVPSALSPFG